MFTGFLLSFREGLEAALIVGIVLGVLKQAKHKAYIKAAWGGVFSAIFFSGLIAFVLYLLGIQIEGAAKVIFEGLTMLLAAGVLTWMIFWMQRQASYLRQELEIEVSQAVSSSGGKALFTLTFLAVLREGIELALFLTAAAFSAGCSSTWQGGLVGLVVSIYFGWVFFATTIQLEIKPFFQITSVLLTLFAAGLVGHGVHELTEMGWIPSIIDHVWDINPYFDEKSLAGSLFASLFGYNGNPSLSEVIAYLGYSGLVVVRLWRESVRRTIVH